MNSDTFFTGLGKSSLDLLQGLGAASKMFVRALRVCPFCVRPHLLFSQMVYIGYNSLMITTITSFFTGMVLAMQLSFQMKDFGATMYVGGVVAVSMARELGPVLTAIVVAGRVGAAITAEIGTMKVTEQIDALRTLATDPIDYLVVPRLQAGMIMLPILTLFSVAMGCFGGYLIGVFKLNIGHAILVNNIAQYLTLADIFSGMIKAFFFGMMIIIIGCYKGFNTTSGAEGVGKATTESVVLSSIAILISDYFLTALILMFI